MPERSERQPAASRQIAIVLTDQVELLEAAGPAQIFLQAADEAARIGAAGDPPYRVVFLSRGGRVATSAGVALETVALAAAEPDAFDTVIVSGCPARTAAANGETIAWLRSAAGRVRRVASTCTGAFLLAEAGFLEGRRAATHWAYCDELQRRFPGIEVDGDSIFVEDGGIWTSAGATAGMDLALAMVEEDLGRDLALAVARRLVLFLQRPGGQSQFSAPLQGQTVEGQLKPLLAWMLDNPDADLRTERLAERANMSLRNFHRAFLAATGRPPAEWVEEMRLQLAKRLLEQSAEHVDRIALRSGFGTYQRMWRSFVRRIGVTPADYRARFARGGRPSGPPPLLAA